MLVHLIRRLVEVTPDETGQVLVLFTVLMPVLLGFGLLVVDLGRAFEHQQHLQLQADAGALAAALEFQPCNNEKIESVVREYSGKEGSTHTYNKQIGGTEDKNILEAINSKTYPRGGTEDKTVSTKAPCEANMVDVKITETDLPVFFQAFNVENIIAHARVEVRQETSTNGASILPVALADSSPRSAAACYVNEATGAVIATTPLKKTGVQNGLDIWSNEAAEAAEKSVPINASGIAVRVALSGSTSGTSCTDPQAKVYDLSSTKVGILHIQGWTGNGTGGDGGAGHPKPIAREARLLGGTCSDPYFSNPAAGSECTIGVSAVVDYGATTSPGAAVAATVSGKSYALKHGSGNEWSTTGSPITVKADSGSVPVELEATDTAMGGAKKGVKFAAIQRSYTAGAKCETELCSGPIQSAELSEKGVGDADSFRMCETGFTTCTHELVLTIGTVGLVNATPGATNPVLSFPAKRGIENCPSGENLKQRLAKGCEGEYALNTGTPCSTGPPVVTCVELEHGTKANQFATGLNERILHEEKPRECTAPNHWSSFPELPKADPRIVTIVVVPFGTGPEPYPIEAFGTFYITGWEGEGNGFKNPCQGQGDDPAAKGQMVGHFIKYTNTTDTGGGGSTLCEPEAFGQCVAILTQ